MEIDPAVKSRVWWGGATSAALRGIPQGMLLGAVAAGILFVTIAAMVTLGGPTLALSTAQAFGGFLYSHGIATALTTATAATAGPMLTSIASVSLLPIVLFNTVLTSVGNFLTGGDIAVNAYKQQVDHDANVNRLDRLEAREMMLEQSLPRSRAVDKILATGPRSSHAEQQEERAADAAQTGPTLH